MLRVCRVLCDHGIVFAASSGGELLAESPKMAVTADGYPSVGCVGVNALHTPPRHIRTDGECMRQRWVAMGQRWVEGMRSSCDARGEVARARETPGKFVL